MPCTSRENRKRESSDVDADARQARPAMYRGLQCIASRYSVVDFKFGLPGFYIGRLTTFIKRRVQGRSSVCEMRYTCDSAIKARVTLRGTTWGDGYRSTGQVLRAVVLFTPGRRRRTRLSVTEKQFCDVSIQKRKSSSSSCLGGRACRYRSSCRACLLGSGCRLGPRRCCFRCPFLCRL